MKLLLDTHALIWWFNGDGRLSPAARLAIEDESNSVLVSAVSAMEITTKHRIGKLPQARTLAARFEQDVAAQGFDVLPISIAHSALAGRLVVDHRDPFDRLLIAQALLDGLTLVSNEQIFDAAGVSRLW